jgi:hypothetical protein
MTTPNQTAPTGDTGKPLHERNVPHWFLSLLAPFIVFVPALIVGLLAYLCFTGAATLMGARPVDVYIARYMTLLFACGTAGWVASKCVDDLNTSRIGRWLISLWCGSSGTFLAILVFNVSLRWEAELAQTSTLLQRFVILLPFSWTEILLGIIVATGMAIGITITTIREAKRTLEK